MKLMLEVKYTMEDGNSFHEYFPCKNREKGIKALHKRMRKEFFEVGPVSVETAGVLGLEVTEHAIH